MEHRIAPEVVSLYLRTMERLDRAAETSASEAFRWLGWATAIAAVKVVDIRTHSAWLQVVPYVLLVLVSGRIQWLIGVRHPEKLQPDGSLVITFQRWRMLVPVVGWLLTWVVAFGAADLIAKSDLLPPQGVTAVAQPPHQATNADLPPSPPRQEK
jgi:hypothetical protein